MNTNLDYAHIAKSFTKTWGNAPPPNEVGSPKKFDLAAEVTTNETIDVDGRKAQQAIFWNRLMVRKHKGNLEAAYRANHVWRGRAPSNFALIQYADFVRVLPDFDWVRLYTIDSAPSLKVIKESPEFVLSPSCIDLAKMSDDSKSLQGHRSDAVTFPSACGGFDTPSLYLNKEWGLCPDFTFWCYGKSYTRGADGVMGWINFYKEASSRVPKPNPKPQMVWRGSCGPLDNLDISRVQLRHLSDKHPEIIDARCVNREGEEHSLSPFEMSDNYKYILESGGGGFSARVKWMLLLQRLCFIREKHWSTFYEINLKPYVHYIPIKEDFSNLIEQYEWAEENKEKCEEIIENAFTFAQNCMSPETLNLHWYRIFSHLTSTPI